jgi:RNA polymerase sigma-70 factor, ECF subfamily
MKADIEKKFIEQLKENQNIIHKVCRIYTTDEDAHKDLFQEITIQLWNAYPKFRGESKFTTWAYRVSLNTAISLYRKNSRSINTNSYDVNQHYYIENLDYNYEEEEQLKLLYKAIHQLNDIEKALILLYLEDKDYEEIAETLGITEVNARVKMNRVKTKLKKILNP